MIIALILLFILLYLWSSRSTFGRTAGQQFLMPHKWLSATSHPLGMKQFDYSTMQNANVCHKAGRLSVQQDQQKINEKLTNRKQ